MCHQRYDLKICMILITITTISYYGCGGGGGGDGGGGEDIRIIGVWAGSIGQYDITMNIEEQINESLFGTISTPNSCFIKSDIIGMLEGNQLSIIAVPEDDKEDTLLTIEGTWSGNTITGVATISTLDIDDTSCHAEGKIVLTR